MVFVYIKIYYAARERARRVINKPGLAKRVSRRFTGKSSNANPATNNAAAVVAANKKGLYNIFSLNTRYVPYWPEDNPRFLFFIQDTYAFRSLI